MPIRSNGTGPGAASGDILTMALPKGFETTTYNWTINKGAGFVPIAGATGATYQLTPNEIPPIGSEWPIIGRAGPDLNLVSRTFEVINPPIAPTVLTAPVITGQPTQYGTATATGATFDGLPAPTVVRTWYIDNVLFATAATAGPLPVGLLRVRDTATNSGGVVFADSPAVQVVALDAPLPAIPAGTMLSNYTTAARSLPASMTDNTDGPSPGKTSNVTGFLAPGGTINMMPLDIGASAVDLTAGIVSITFRLRPTGTLSNAIANLGTCYVNLYNDGNPAAAKTNYLRISFGSFSSMGERITGQWQTLRFPIEIITAGAVVGSVPDIPAYLQTVRYVGLQFSHNSTNSDPFRVSVDFSNNIENPITKGMVIIGFDDCRRDTFAYAYPKLDALGFPGVIYPGAIMTLLDSNDAFYMNTANLLELQGKGWDLLAQAGYTESPTNTGPQFAIEMDEMKAFYLARGLHWSDDGSYFSNVGYGTEPYQDVFEQKFRTMRGFTQFNSAAFPRPETLPPSNPFELRAFGVNTAANAASNTLIPYVQRAITRKSVAIIIFHALGASDTIHGTDGGLTTYEALLANLDLPATRAGCDVVSWTEAVRRWRLAASLGL